MTAARLSLVLEALECGDAALARDLVEDLLRELPAPAGQRRCPECSFRGWPGELEDHTLREHSWRRAA